MPRRPPHFKTYTSIANHWKTAAIWADPILRATYVELGRIAIEKYADRTGNTFLVNSGELMFATGCGAVGAASKRLEKLVRVARESFEAGPISGGRRGVDEGYVEGRPAVEAEKDGSSWRVRLHNLAEKQFSRSGNGTETVPPSTTTSTTTTYTPRNPPSKRTPTPRAQGQGGRRKAPPPPEWATSTAQRLAVLVREHAPGAKVPSTPTPWAREIARIDDTPEAVAAVVEWLFGENERRECRFVVQSGKALREKYGRIRAAMSRPEGGAHAARNDRRSLTGAVERILERDERRAARARGAPGQALRVVPGDPGA